MLHTWSKEHNTAFYSYLARFVNTFTLNVHVFMPFVGSTGGIRYLYSDGCATGILEYQFENAMCA